MTPSQQLSQAKAALESMQRGVEVTKRARALLIEAEAALAPRERTIEETLSDLGRGLRGLAESLRIQMDAQIESSEATIAGLAEQIQIAESPIARANMVPPRRA